MRSQHKDHVWFVAVLLLIGLITGCQQQFGPQPPAFSGGVMCRAVVMDSQGRTLGVFGVRFTVHLTQVSTQQHGILHTCCDH